MVQYIDKDALVAEIEKRKQDAINNCGGFKSLREHECDSCIVGKYEEMEEILNTLEVKDLYEQCVQYSSIEDGIKAHAEVYSFNIESELFNQLTKEQQALWRKEIEQACISGGDAGVGLARDIRYEENKQVQTKVNLEDLFQALPEKIADEKSHQVYELSIYHYDGQCVVDYVGEIDHDSLYTFNGNTLYEAIEKAYNWLFKNSTGG